MPHSPALNSYYSLGRSGLRVSRLALGTVKDTARQLVNTYVDAGGTVHRRRLKAGQTGNALSFSPRRAQCWLAIHTPLTDNYSASQ